MRMTKLRQQCLDDLATGAKLVVTLAREERLNASYEIQGGGRKYNKAFLDAFVPLAFEAGLLTESDPGLFQGCGQSYIVVRE